MGTTAAARTLFPTQPHNDNTPGPPGAGVWQGAAARRTLHVRRPFSFFVPHSNLALKTKTTAAAAVAPLSGRGDSCRLCWREGERLAAVHSIRPTTTTVVHTRSFVAQVNAEGERGRQTFRCSRRSPPRSPLDRPSAAPSPVAALTHMVGPHHSGDHWWLRAAGAWSDTFK